MIRINIKVLSIIFFLPIISFAQNNFKPGYIVAYKGDTIPGFIEYKKWNQNPTSISFKTYRSNPHFQTYTINDISYFNVTDLAEYKKFRISTSTLRKQSESSNAGVDSNSNSTNVFLRVLAKGKFLALYLYKEDAKSRFFVGQKPEFVPRELEYDENNGVKPNLQPLYTLAEKYNVLNDDLAKLFMEADFSKKSLIDLVNKINNAENK